MTFEKKVLCDMDHCYAVSAMPGRGGRLQYFFAAENDNPCYAFDPKTGGRETVWEHPGGTMSMVPLPGREGEFLAVQYFRSGFMAQDTILVWVRPTETGWQVKTVLKLPFIHRFDILMGGGQPYLLVCTLATSKKDTADWGDPGKLWGGKLPADLNEPIQLEILEEGLLKNHGYCRTSIRGCDAGLSTSEMGVLQTLPPQTSKGVWTTEKLLDRPVSDVAVVDIDGDGEKELALIAPFHGGGFTVDKQVDGRWETMYRYEGDFDFGHAVWGGCLRGKPAFLGGARRGAKELFLVTWHGSGFDTTVLDAGGGPSNVAVIHGGEADVILSANREAAQAVLYTVRD